MPRITSNPARRARPGWGTCARPRTCRGGSPDAADAWASSLARLEPRESAPDAVPPRFPGYDVIGLLGRGGMGVVWKAYDTALRRAVAIKTLTGIDAGDRERFVREARAAASVRHANVIQIQAVRDEPDVTPFLVMELVEGPSLRDEAGRTRGLEPSSAATICAAAADGLAAAHAAGIVHRDLKPANILLAPARGTENAAGPFPKVADFGLARAAGDAAGLTRSGVVLGTPAYMSPEQVRDPTRADVRSDVYGLGATLYEALTGVELFRGSVQLVSKQVLEDDPVPPRRLNPGIPRHLETICLMAMAKEPERRYVSAAAFRDDLHRWLRAEPITARPVGPVGRVRRWARRNPTVSSLIAAVVVAVAADFGAVTWQWRKADAQHELAEANYLRVCESLRFWMADGELSLRTAQGLAPARRAWLDRSLFQVRGDPAESSRDPATEFAVAAVQVQIALHATQHGKPADAEAAFAEAERLFIRAANTPPRNPHARADEANVQIYLGELHLYVTGRTKEALGRYRRALTLWERAVAEDGTPQRRRNVALCRYLVASAHLASGEYHEARVALDDAQSLLAPLLAEFPDEPDYRQRLASVEHFDGELYLRVGNHGRAVECLLRCRAIREEGLRRQPWDIALQRDTARVDRLLGHAHRAGGDVAAATEAFARARSRLDPLANDNPHLPRLRHALAGVLADEGRSAEAAALLARLACEYPDAPALHGP